MFPLFPSTAAFIELIQQPVAAQQLGHTFRKHAELNRYTLLTAQGPLALTAPVAHPVWQVPYGQVRLSYQAPWPEKHSKTLHSAYRAAPYYDHYQENITKILRSQPAFLHELATECLSFCLQATGFAQTTKILTIPAPECLEKPFFGPILTADTYTSPPIVPPPSYQSVFGAPFDSKISILDTLLCLGPHRLHAYLRMYLTREP